MYGLPHRYIKGEQQDAEDYMQAEHAAMNEPNNAAGQLFYGMMLEKVSALSQ